MRIALALVLLAGCTSAPAADAPWHGRALDDSWMQWELKSCQVMELDFHYHETQTFAWDWVSVNQVPLRFSVHTHVGRGIVEIVNTTDIQHRGSLTFETETTYSLMWENLGASSADLWRQHDDQFSGVLGAACAPEATPM